MREEARHCKERLELAEAKILGLLVNRVDEDSGRGYKKRYYRRYQSYREEGLTGAPSDTSQA